MSDRDLVRRLILALQLDQLLDRQALLRQPLLQPAAREGQHRILLGQALTEFRHERTRHGRIGFRQIGHHHDEMAGVGFKLVLQAVHPLAGEVPVLACDGQAADHPLQIFNQAEPQHHGNGPEFAQLQGGGGLIGGDEGAQRLRLDLRVDMRDQLQDDVVHARQPGGRPGGKPGQFPAVSARQMPPGEMDLFLQQVEIIEQPFGGGGDAAGGRDGAGRLIVGAQGQFVLVQAREQAVGMGLRHHPVSGRQGAGMAGELFDAEQLGVQRRIGLGVAGALQPDGPGRPTEGENRQQTHGWAPPGLDQSLSVPQGRGRIPDTHARRPAIRRR